MNMTLLEQAKAMKTGHSHKKSGATKEELEVIVAFLNGEITSVQGAEVLKTSKQNFVVFVMARIRNAAINNMVSIKIL